MARPRLTPLRVLLVVGGIAGVVMTFVVPRFAGIDEPYHYLRSWAITDGTLMPEKGPLPGDVDGGGLCVPTGLVDDVFAARRPYLRTQSWFEGADPLKTTTCPGEGRPDHRFVDVATFSWYTPVGYVPQAVGVGLGRVVGLGPAGQSLLARLASLAAYLAMCGWAVASAPRARWALVSVALLPVSLFQAVTSLSPDGFTIAAVLVLVAAALRAADADRLHLSHRRVATEALVACGLVAAAKPTYVVMVAVYGIVWCRRQEGWSRAQRAVTMAPAALALAASAAWSAAFRPLFVCDVRYFGVATDADGSLSAMAHRPWDAVAASVTGTIDNAWRWVSDVIAIGTDRIVTWPTALAAAVLAVMITWAMVAAPRDHPSSAPRERIVLVAVAALGFVTVIAGWLISCSPPGLEIVNPPHARVLVPALVPLLVGLGGWWRPRRSRRTIVAISLSAGAIWLAWLATAAVTMH